MPIVIAFDKVTYTSGSLVSGHVVVVRKSPQKVKGLSMRFVGRGSVSAPDNGTQNKRKDTYFDHKIDIFGHDGRDSVVGVGETLFPFSFALPPGLPSSFMWSRGNILYFVEARLTRSSWKEDKRVSCRLNVEGTFDLNLDPSSVQPLSLSRSKYVQHILTKSGPLAFSLSTTRSGFVKGQVLPFHLQLKNLSKVNSKKVKVSLLQEVSGDGKEWSEVVEEVKGPTISAGDETMWEGQLTLPPDIPPTNLGNILNFPPPVGLNYFLQIELGLKSATVEPLTAKVPVTIGTIGLLRSRDRLRFQQRHHHTHEEACPLSQFSPFLMPPQPPPSCRHCNSSRHIHRRLRQLQRRRRESPPPTYDEAVGGDGDGHGREDKGQCDDAQVPASSQEDTPPQSTDDSKDEVEIVEPSTSQGTTNKYVVTLHVKQDEETSPPPTTL